MPSQLLSTCCRSGMSVAPQALLAAGAGPVGALAARGGADAGAGAPAGATAGAGTVTRTARQLFVSRVSRTLRRPSAHTCNVPAVAGSVTRRLTRAWRPRPRARTVARPRTLRRVPDAVSTRTSERPARPRPALRTVVANTTSVPAATVAGASAETRRSGRVAACADGAPARTRTARPPRISFIEVLRGPEIMVEPDSSRGRA